MGDSDPVRIPFRRITKVADFFYPMSPFHRLDEISSLAFRDPAVRRHGAR
jgi:hypothetical protein